MLKAQAFCVLFLGSLLLAADYDPLKTSKDKAEFKDDVVKDDSRKRDIPIRVYLPKDPKPAPVLLFSHGLGGSREGSPYLGHHWAQHGYVAVFLQHPGSDVSVWKDTGAAKRMEALNKAANNENLQLRVKDVPSVLDQLDSWNKPTSGHFLSKRLDMKHVGMSGHSFGAITTQAVSGQTLLGKALYTDPRIKAAVVMSPSSPRIGDAKKAFSSVKIPWLLMTGTNDLSPIGGIDMKSRLAVYPALPENGKSYELVLDKAEHSAFTERALPGEKEKRNPNHHKVILSLSTAFWDAYLRDDAEAKKWLDGAKAKAVLEKGDSWKRK
jgi:predicted dienelactone hydrolase